MSPELKKFLEEPGAHLVLHPDLTVCLVGPEFSRITGLPTKSDGLNLTGVYTGPDSSVDLLLQSLARVKQTRETDKLEDIVLNVRTGNEIQSLYLRVNNVPVLDNSGNLTFIVHRIEDFTLLWMVRRENQRLKRSIVTLFMITLSLFFLLSYLYTNQRAEQSASVRESCQVQQRALPAQRHLAIAMKDIHTVLAFPQPPEQGLFFRTLSPKQQKLEIGVINDLNFQLNRFYFLTSSQPLSRNCKH